MTASRIVVLAALVLLAACEQNSFVPPPPPKVEVATPTQRPVTRYLETTGNTPRSSPSTWSRASRASCSRSSIRTAPS